MKELKPWVSNVVAPWDKLPEEKPKEIRWKPEIKENEQECEDYWT